MASLSASGSAKKRRESFSTSWIRPSSIAMADEVEEADVAGRVPQVFQETRALRCRTVESTKVEGGKGLDLDGDRHRSLLDDC